MTRANCTPHRLPLLRAAPRKRFTSCTGYEKSGLAAGVDDFRNWSQHQLLTEQEATKIIEPLYHYTGAGGLRGIVESQKIWFTSYLHLNDPSELIYGMEIVHRLLNEIGEGAHDPLVKRFCAMVDDLFQHRNFSDVFGFYIASFSRNRDELGQWRGYADNGRGFALGLAPHLFEIVNTADLKPTEKYVVMPVVYEQEKAEQRYRAAIEAAAGIVGNHRPHETIEERFFASKVPDAWPTPDTLERA
jgi:hypothetical protein